MRETPAAGCSESNGVWSCGAANAFVEWVDGRECAFLETACERAEFPVPAGNDISAKWPSEGMRATDRARPTVGAKLSTQHKPN